MEKNQSQGQSQLDLIHHTSLKELVNPVRDRLPNTLHLLGTLREFLTTRHFIVQVVNDFSGVPVRTNLERVFEVVSIIAESPRNFLVGGSALLEPLELLHLASREELVDDIGDALTNTLHLLGTLRKFFATGHLEWELVDDMGGMVIRRTLVLILFVVGETVEHVSQLTVVGDEELIIRVRLVVRLLKNLSLSGGDRFGVLKVLVEELVNLGGNTLPNTLNLEEALTILHLKVEGGDDVRSCVVRRSLVKVGGHLTKFLEVLGDVLIQLEGLGSGSRLVEGRFVEDGSNSLNRFIENLRIEFLESGFGLSVEFLELFVALLELLDVFEDGSRVHVCSWLCE
jgi:hypothetical protein